MDVGVLARGHTEFLLHVYKAVASSAPNQNLVLSPISIGLALAMLAAGATGPTLEEIASCLKLPVGDPMHKFSAQLKDVLTADATKHGLQLSCANRIWVDNTIRLQPRFQKLLLHTYGAPAASADFLHKPEEARQTVNKWAEDETHGKIANILPPDSLSKDTRLILANAIYFKGTWEQAFIAAMTENLDFFLPDGTTVKVPTMQSWDDQYVISYPAPPPRSADETSNPSPSVTYTGPAFKALRLPYRLQYRLQYLLHYEARIARSFSMIVLLPNDKNGLREMEEKLDVHTLVHELHFGEPKSMTRFQLPKFRMSFKMEMKETLASLGMERVFADDPELGGMTEGDKNLSVDSVYHKAFVEVNEKGTEAAAVTMAPLFVGASGGFRDEEFVADHPFMFLIVEESTNTIIFTGRVVDPEAMAPPAEDEIGAMYMCIGVGCLLGVCLFFRHFLALWGYQLLRQICMRWFWWTKNKREKNKY